MGQIADIDIWGRENSDGTAKEHFDDFAINNSLVMWMTSKKGDFIMNPRKGGVLENFNFKNMTNTAKEDLEFLLKTEVNLIFNSLITLTGIIVLFDYENRITEIRIVYTSNLSGLNRTTKVYIDSKIESQKFKYEDVELIEQNLESYVLIRQAAMGKKRLIYNLDEESWVWGRYKLINLTNTDPYFTRILSLINGDQ